jgi:hypothetical protein
VTDIAIVLDVDDENPVANDLRLVAGQLVLTTGTDAIRQDLAVRLRWFKGEWFLDRRTGVPWFQSILGHKAEDITIERIIRRVIQTTPGVEAILSLSITLDSTERELAISFRALATTGDVIEFFDFILDLEPTDLREAA